MKAKEIRAISGDKIAEKLRSLYQESFNLRFQNATAQLENKARIRTVRKDIARIKTILGENALAQQRADQTDRKVSGKEA